MNDNVVLQVILHEGDGLEIRLGNEEKINPLALVGILEQVKFNILSGGSQVEEVSKESKEKPKYDA